MLALTRCCDVATEKCASGPGIAIVSSYNTRTSSGMLAYYGERLAKNGLVGLVFAVSPEYVCLHIFFPFLLVYLFFRGVGSGVGVGSWAPRVPLCLLRAPLSLARVGESCRVP